VSGPLDGVIGEAVVRASRGASLPATGNAAPAAEDAIVLATGDPACPATGDPACWDTGGTGLSAVGDPGCLSSAWDAVVPATWLVSPWPGSGCSFELEVGVSSAGVMPMCHRTASGGSDPQIGSRRDSVGSCLGAVSRYGHSRD
jgi:hypothetical protein